MTTLYGEYGGRYVPETLIPALDELDSGLARRARRRRVPRRARPSRDDVRRPADAADARGAVRARQAHLPQARGSAPHRRAQAQQRARPGGARAAARQDADRRRDRRRPARRRDGDGLRALRARVRRLHGRRGHAPPAAERRADGPARRGGRRPVEFGTKTLKEATSEAIRDWITNVETTHYLIGSCVGPAPYPELVRGAAVGDRPRGARADARGRGPAAGRGGRVRRRRLERDRHLPRLPRRRGRAAVGVEAAGAASLGTGRAGVLHGARSSVLADEDGQIADAHSISAGLDYPGVGPEHAYLRDTGRVEYVHGDRRRGARTRSATSRGPRGSSRRSSRRTRSRAHATSTRS